MQQKQQRLMIIDQNKQKLLRDNAGLIPATGVLLDAGAWIPDPQNPDKTKRLRLPQDSIFWLYTKLQDQGYMQAELNQMSPELNAQRFDAGQQAAPQGQMQMPPQMMPGMPS